MDDDLHLVPGERLLWSGGPQAFPVFEADDLVVVPFSLAWPGFAAVWVYSAAGTGGVVFTAVAGTPFVLIGLYLTVGRLVVRAVQLRSTHYAVTTLRLIEIVWRPWPKRTEVYLRSLPPPMTGPRDEQRGVGSVAFGRFRGPGELLALAAGRHPRHHQARPVMLCHIGHPGLVRDLIIAAQTHTAPNT